MSIVALSSIRTSGQTASREYEYAPRIHRHRRKNEEPTLLVRVDRVTATFQRPNACYTKAQILTQKVAV